MKVRRPATLFTRRFEAELRYIAERLRARAPNQDFIMDVVRLRKFGVSVTAPPERGVIHVVGC